MYPLNNNMFRLPDGRIVTMEEALRLRNMPINTVADRLPTTMANPVGGPENIGISPAQVNSAPFKRRGEHPLYGANPEDMPAPAQMPASPPQSQSMGLLDRLKAGFSGIDSNDALMALGSAMLGMSQDPNLQKLGMSGFGQVQKNRDERKTKESLNKTIKALRDAKRDDLADAVESGLLKAADAAGILFKDKQTKPIKLGKGEQLLDPETFAVLATGPSGGDAELPTTFRALQLRAEQAGLKEGTPEYQQFMLRGGIDTSKPEVKDLMKIETDLRTEFMGQAFVKDYINQSDAFSKLGAAAAQNTPAGDMALIFGYMKVLDPTSTVREGEFQTAASLGGIADQMSALYKKAMGGGMLTADQRNQILKSAQAGYDAVTEQFKQRKEFYVKKAGEYGISSPENVYPPIQFAGGLGGVNAPPLSKPDDMPQDLYDLLLETFKGVR